MKQDKHKTTFIVSNMDPHNYHTSQWHGSRRIVLIFNNRVPVCTPKCTSVLFFPSFEKLPHCQHSYANLNSNQSGKASNANVIDKMKVLRKVSWSRCLHGVPMFRDITCSPHSYNFYLHRKIGRFLQFFSLWQMELETQRNYFPLVKLESFKNT